MAVTFSAVETSNRDWTWQFSCTDEETGDAIDFTGATIVIGINDASDIEVISASTDDGKITLVDSGVIQLAIPYSETNLEAGSYTIGGYYQLNDETLDLLSGTITVRKGIPAP